MRWLDTFSICQITEMRNPIRASIIVLRQLAIRCSMSAKCYVEVREEKERKKAGISAVAELQHNKRGRAACMESATGARAGDSCAVSLACKD